jgi:molybdopterin converting factor small subunit
MLRPILAKRQKSRVLLVLLEKREEKRMAVKVIIPTPLRAYAGKRDSTEVKAATVGEALGRLTTEFGDLRKHLFTEEGKLRSFVNVYVNDEDIRYLAKENTPTKDGDTISIVPSIAGGLCLSHECCSHRHS